jgi:lysophospholipase L1-like esterase
MATALGLTAQAPPSPDRWEPAIKAFEEGDRLAPPPKEGIVFIGSSSIRRWDLAKYFPGLPAVNRGFGGSQMEDSARYADRILLPLKPKTVVVYAGDNDIAAGKSPERVVADSRALAAKVHAALPKTKIIFISIKPSLQRWALIDKIRETNRLLREMTAKDDRLFYLDVDKPMIGKDGKPKPELFVEDGLHMTDAGNQLWADLLKPLL